MSSEFDIKISTCYLPEQSNPEELQFVFAYTIDITNNGERGAKLMRRHWIITDADGKKQEVEGEGVIGEQPFINVGETYQYTSGAILTTPLGTMHGSYQMEDDLGHSFQADIPLFSLTQPGILH